MRWLSVNGTATPTAVLVTDDGISSSIGLRLTTLQQRRLALLSALLSPEKAHLTLADFTQRMWFDQLRWLDTSGLALYLFGGLCDHGHAGLVPQLVRQRWDKNLQDNAARMDQLAEEALSLHRAFQSRQLCYATLKGFSLHPHSVPRMERRSQLDLDFLIAEEHAGQARNILEDHGYTLRAISGRSWEFKKNENAAMTLRDIYKPLDQYSVELHLEYPSGKSPLLPRARWQAFRDSVMPVLHPVDLFLGQGLHLFKHINSEFFRVAHLYEFRQHVMSRYDDDAFWHEVRGTANADPRTIYGLGVAIALITRVTGDFAPPLLTDWTSDRLSGGLRRWIDTFAVRVSLDSHPGSKLYLLLQQELEALQLTSRRTLRQSLLPRALPPPITAAAGTETLREKIGRNRRQLSFILFRLRFHVVEGTRYLYHALRWNRNKAGEGHGPRGVS